MSARTRIAIVGAGNLAAALAASLHQAGYKIEEVIARSGSASFQRAKRLARKHRARASIAAGAKLDAAIVWFCVPDAAIRSAAGALASTTDWSGKIVFHSSGALASDELGDLRSRGAAIASVHPLMTFVRQSRASLKGVPFAIEGDRVAVKVARRIVSDLGGRSYSIRKADKAAYHAWGTFASPLLVALLATAERVAGLAGVNRKTARERMIPILTQTLTSYAALGAAGAFSGPIARGDFETVKKHLHVLQSVPEARDAYIALARTALRYLPAKRRSALMRVLNNS